MNNKYIDGNFRSNKEKNNSMMSSQINMEVGSEAEYSVSNRAVSTAKLETIMNKAPRHIGETSIIVFT